MQYFFHRIIAPYIIENKYKVLCEIGASKGGNTDQLLGIPAVNISIIDPCIDGDLSTKYENVRRVKIYKGLSLEVLPKILERFDCILIDGDHNWYTVFNELKIIDRRNLIKEGGTILFHDVCWPYGRRDMYYLPESIPKELRHPYEKKGIEIGKSELSAKSTFNNNANNAIYEGGQKNGVLTAIEDFLKNYDIKYLFFYFKIERGLGFLVRKKDVRTNVIYIKWRCLTKYYEILVSFTYFIKIRFPNIYLLFASIGKAFNFKLRI